MRSNYSALPGNFGTFPHALAQRFLRNEGGSSSVQVALIFGAAAIALALAGAPLMQIAGDRFASGASVDRTTTGSITPANRFTVRRSVLHGGEEIVCGGTVNCLKQ